MRTDLERSFARNGLPEEPRAPVVNSLVALDFAEETVREAQRGRRTAIIVMSLLIVVCAVQAAAIAIMLPLKETVPYTIVVDRQTGYMETARGLQSGALKDDSAVLQSLLAQYVLQRETFDPADFEDRYRRVALWSTGQARTDYIAGYQPGPASVLADKRNGTVITARVKNIELMAPGQARVRYDLTRRDPGLAPAMTEWQAVLRYQFTGAPLKMSDRLINPLGFQVTSYRADAVWLASPEIAAAVRGTPAGTAEREPGPDVLPAPAQGGAASTSAAEGSASVGPGSRRAPAGPAP